MSTITGSIIYLSLNLPSFLVGLDNTIISGAIPKITDQFHALDDVGMVRQRLPPNNMFLRTDMGQPVHLLHRQMDLHAALFIFRARLADLRGSADLHSLNCRSCNCRCWRWI